MLAVVITGLVLLGGSLFNISDLLFFGLLGLLLASVGGYLMYDKRKRINEASEKEQDTDVIEAMEEMN